MQISFTIPCNPPKSTHQASQAVLKNKKTGKHFIGKMQNSKGKKVRGSLMQMFAAYRPKSMFEGPVELRVVWAYAWKKSEPKKNKEKGYKYCDTRPDCDNLLKLVKDVLTDLAYWHDDSQVARLVFTKIWCDNPHITINIKNI